MPTVWAVALSLSLFSGLPPAIMLLPGGLIPMMMKSTTTIYIGSGNFQKTNAGGQDLATSATTTKNETKKEDKLTKILPLVTFDCTGRTEGYYADVQFDCEAFHYCKSSGERFTFVCPPKSRFNQKHMVCDYDRYGLKLCYTAEKYFKLNENLYPKTEDDKNNTKVLTTTVKPETKIEFPTVKKQEALSREETKHVKQPETNKTKLEKTYIVTEYYNHDLLTTEQPLINDASPKVYKWYTPPVTSDSPLDDVEYDDSIRHQYEYPDDYPEDEDYDHSYPHSHSDQPEHQTPESYNHDKSKNNGNYNHSERRKSNKDEAKKQSNSEDKVHYDSNKKQNQEKHETKESELPGDNYSASQNGKHYENSNSKDTPHSKPIPQMEIRKKEASESQTAKEIYRHHNEPQLKGNHHSERINSVPKKEEAREYENDDRAVDIYNVNPTSDEQIEENHNYQQEPNLRYEQETEISHHQNNKEDESENYAANKAEHKELPQESWGIRNEEQREIESTSRRRIIDQPQSKYYETVNPENSHNREESNHRMSNPKINQYKIILNRPEIKTNLNTQHRIPEEKRPKTSLPHSKSKTMTFYRRYTSKMEKPTHTTVYREVLPHDDEVYRTLNKGEKEIKYLQNYHQQDKPQKQDLKEMVNQQGKTMVNQRERQISLPNPYHREQSFQGDSEKDSREGSYEEGKEEINNQNIPSRKHNENEQHMTPQRNMRLYIEQELPQQRQIQAQVYTQPAYQHDHNKDRQQDVSQEHSEEVIPREHMQQYRQENPREEVYNQAKLAQYSTINYENPPEKGYFTHHYNAARNEERDVHIINPRPQGVQNHQYSNQHHSRKQSKGYRNKKPINMYQLNKNVREKRPMLHQEVTVQPQNHQVYQHNIREKLISRPRLIPKQMNMNMPKAYNRPQNDRQQQRETNYRHHIPEQFQQSHQPHRESLHDYNTRYSQHYTPESTHFHHYHTSEQPKIRIITRRQKRQTSGGLPLSSQFRALLNRLYVPVGSASNNHLNNFQNFIASSFPSQSSETSRNPTQDRTNDYFPRYNYNPRHTYPYNTDVQTLYDRSPVYSNPSFEQTPYYYQAPNRSPLSSYPNHFRYFDDNGEQLNQDIRNSPQKPEVESPTAKPTSSNQEDSTSKPTLSVEQKEPQQLDNSRNKPIYPPLPTINPQTYPELRDFPFFNPSFPYSEGTNTSSKDGETSQFSYNRIPPPRYPVPDLGVYFDPYAEFGVTPLYESSQTNSDNAKDADSTESPETKDPEKNERKNGETSRRRVPGKVKRPFNSLSNPHHENKHQPYKPRDDFSLFVTAPPRSPENTYNPQSVHLFVTPPSFLTGHSRAPSVFGPEFFVPPLRPPFTTESTSEETTDNNVTQDSSLEKSSDVTTHTPSTQVTTPKEIQRNHRRRPQATSRPQHAPRSTTRRPSTIRSPVRHHATSDRSSSRHSSESIKPQSELSKNSKPTIRRPISTRPPTRHPVRERPKPATLPAVRPTQSTTPQSDSSDDEEPNPFRGSVPYGTRLRRPAPSRQTASQLSHERPRALTKKINQQSSASDQSITIAKQEPRQRARHIQSIEKSHQTRISTNQLREPTPSPTSTTSQSSSQTGLPSRNIFRYSNEEATTMASYHLHDDDATQRVRRPNVRRAIYFRKDQNLKPETKPKLFRGRTRTYHPRRGYIEITTQSSTTTTLGTVTSSTSTSTTKIPPKIVTSIETTTPQTTVETEPTSKLRVYTSRHGGSLRNERVINRLKDKPRLFTFGRPRGGIVDDSSSFDDTNFATESSSESKLSTPTR